VGALRIFGEREAWDSALYFVLVLPALTAGCALAGWNRLRGAAWVAPAFGLALAHGAWRARADRAARTALVATALPIVFTVATAWTVGGDFQTRYLIAATPGAALAVASGLIAQRAWTLPLGGALLALGLGAHSRELRTRNLREDCARACDELAREWRPGDRVVSITGTEERFKLAPLEHYLRERPEILASVSSWERIETRLA